MIQEAHYRKTNTERVKGACLLSRSASFVVIEEEEGGAGGGGGEEEEGLSRILGCV
jgi:hypothetical protein